MFFSISGRRVLASGFAGFAFLTVCSIVAQNADLSFEQAFDRASVIHPAVIGRRAEVEQTEQFQKRAALLLPANPEIEASSVQGNQSRSFEAGLSQRLETGGQRSIRVEGARLEHDLALLRLKVARLELRGHLRRVYGLFASYKRNVEDLELHEQTLRRLRGGLPAGFRDPRLGIYALRAFDSDLILVSGKIRERKAKYIAVENELRLLVGLGSDERPRIDTLQLPKPPDPESVAKKAEESAPPVQIARLRVELEEQGLEFAKSLIYPDITLFASGGSEVSREGIERLLPGNRNDFMRIGLRVPIPIVDRNQGRSEIARAALIRSQGEFSAARRSARSETLTAVNRYALLHDQLQRLNESMRRADETSSVLTMAFVSRKISYLEFWSEQSRWLETHFQYLETLESCLSSIEDIETATGVAAEDWSQTYD